MLIAGIACANPLPKRDVGIMPSPAISETALTDLGTPVPTVGKVLAESLEIRNVPEGTGGGSYNIGYLYAGDEVIKTGDCVWVHDIQWVRIYFVWAGGDSGWSAVQQGEKIYIERIC